MNLSPTDSKVLAPLISAFMSLVALVLIAWFISYYFTHRVYEVLEKNATSSEKMLILTSLIDTAQQGSRLTGQLLVTKGAFEREEIAKKFAAYTARFNRLREELIKLSLSPEEKTILREQSKLIKLILPKHRAATELAMSGDLENIEKARNIFYNEVIPGQSALINYIMGMLNSLRNDITDSSVAAINEHKRAELAKNVLIVIFVATTMMVASITIRRILSIEKNFNDANHELSRLNNVKSDFISLVSHELRTPLTSIKSFAEILMDDIEDMDVETQKRYLSIIDSEGDRLTRLVSNILDLQKMDANKMVWNDERLILNDLVKDSVDAFSVAFQAKDIEINIGAYTDELTVIADSDKLRQVLANLLSNALKFTEKGEVLVAVYPFKNKNQNGSYSNMAQVSVSDTGSGIPEDQLLKVFDSFHQVDNSSTRKLGGTGLGLDITRKIINHYEGDVWVESDVGNGSTFYFQIPLVHAEKKMIGETLIELGLITDDQLKIALQKQVE